MEEFRNKDKNQYYKDMLYFKTLSTTDEDNGNL